MADNDSKLDPLYSIFEKHLYDYEDNAQTEQALIDKIVHEYVQYLESHSIVVPIKWRMQIMDEIGDQVRQMIVKKMYGCLSVQEFIYNQKARRRKKQRVIKKKC